MLDDETNTPTPIITTAPAPAVTPAAPAKPATPGADIVVMPDTPAPKKTTLTDDADETDDIATDEAPAAPSDAPEAPHIPASEAQPTDDTSIVSDIANRIAEAHNILIALSNNPSVDEMSAAIGLSLALDRAGKRATAIYSGRTPNTLEFLKPDHTFEATADTLQDFVIAISKDKADHLRYKLDGDFVKIYITPYKTRVAEEDLEFSYGDFNIDLVLALNVSGATDLDSALREHGRIMHDATVINITTGNPGKLGKIEWSNKSASSVCELVARLLLSMDGTITLEPDDATALLTGIIAATDQFSNTQTTPDAMRVASELLKLGANQRLISEHLTATNQTKPAAQANQSNQTVSQPEKLEQLEQPESSNQLDQAGKEDLPNLEPASIPEPAKPDATSLDIVHDDEKPVEEVQEHSAEAGTMPDSGAFVTTSAIDEASPAATGVSEEARELEVAPHLEEKIPEPVSESPKPILEPESINEPLPPLEPITHERPELVVPSSNFDTGNPLEAEARKYSQMLEDALAENAPAAAPAVSTAPAAPAISAAPLEPAPIVSPAINPAVEAAPAVPTTPEINGIPEMNFNTPGDILPPPPAPSIDSTLPPMPNDVLAELSRAPIDDFGVAAPAAAPSVMVDSTTPATASAPVSSPAFQIPTA